jgi:hypothetical protein
MAPTMERIAKVAFPKATRVTDRFHVQILAFEALYHFNFEIQPIKKQEFFLWAKKKSKIHELLEK